MNRLAVKVQLAPQLKEKWPTSSLTGIVKTSAGEQRGIRLEFWNQPSLSGIVPAWLAFLAPTTEDEIQWPLEVRLGGQVVACVRPFPTVEGRTKRLLEAIRKTLQEEVRSDPELYRTLHAFLSAPRDRRYTLQEILAVLGYGPIECEVATWDPQESFHLLFEPPVSLHQILTPEAYQRILEVTKT